MGFSMRILKIILLVFITSSCATVGVTQIKSASPKPQNCTLEIFTEEKEVKKPFEVVCLLDAKTGSDILADKKLILTLVH